MFFRVWLGDVAIGAEQQPPPDRFRTVLGGEYHYPGATKFKSPKKPKAGTEGDSPTVRPLRWSGRQDLSDPEGPGALPGREDVEDG